MKKLSGLIILAGFLLLFTDTADAQRRRTTRTPAKPAAASNSFEVNAAAQKVSIQIKNVTKFLYILGGAAKGIEDLDKNNRANQSARSMNETNKRELMQTIRNLRAGLSALETDFRAKPALSKYLLNIQGITTLSGQTEALANQGRFTESGKPLLTVIEKLSDTLAAM